MSDTPSASSVLTSQSQSGSAASVGEGNAPNPAPSTVHVSADGGSGGSYTREQLQTMARWGVEDGHLTPEQANAMLKDDGIAEMDFTPEDPALAELNAAFPAAKPHEYEMPPLLEGNGAYTPEIAKADRQFRGWLSDAEFPRGIGSYVAREVGKVAESVPTMSEPERKLWAKDQQAQLRNLWGNQYTARLAQAEALVAELEAKSPGLTDLLERTGAGNSAFVVAQLAMQAERLAMKRGRRSK